MSGVRHGCPVPQSGGLVQARGAAAGPTPRDPGRDPPLGRQPTRHESTVLTSPVGANLPTRGEVVLGLIVLAVLAYAALAAFVVRRQRRRSRARGEDVIDLTEAERHRLASLDRARSSQRSPRHFRSDDDR